MYSSFLTVVIEITDKDSGILLGQIGRGKLHTKIFLQAARRKDNAARAAVAAVADDIDFRRRRRRRNCI